MVSRSPLVPIDFGDIPFLVSWIVSGILSIVADACFKRNAPKLEV